jgi:hypothetical protein
MHRLLFVFAVAGLAALAVGCSMCDHSSDNCGPVVGENGCESCSHLYRAGSIPSPGAGTAASVANETILPGPPSEQVMDESPQETAPVTQAQPSSAGQWNARAQRQMVTE